MSLASHVKPGDLILTSDGVVRVGRVVHERHQYSGPSVIVLGEDGERLAWFHADDDVIICL